MEKDETERYKDYWLAIYAYVLARKYRGLLYTEKEFMQERIEEYILPKDQELFFQARHMILTRNIFLYMIRQLLEEVIYYISNLGS